MAPSGGGGGVSIKGLFSRLSAVMWIDDSLPAIGSIQGRSQEDLTVPQALYPGAVHHQDSAHCDP